MKKVGMTPLLNNHLNDFVKKKVVQTNMQAPFGTGPLKSNQTSPKHPMSIYDDGTGG